MAYMNFRGNKEKVDLFLKMVYIKTRKPVL